MDEEEKVTRNYQPIVLMKPAHRPASTSFYGGDQKPAWNCNIKVL